MSAHYFAPTVWLTVVLCVLFVYIMVIYFKWIQNLPSVFTVDKMLDLGMSQVVACGFRIFEKVWSGRETAYIKN